MTTFWEIAVAQSDSSNLSLYLFVIPFIPPGFLLCDFGSDCNSCVTLVLIATDPDHSVPDTLGMP